MTAFLCGTCTPKWKVSPSGGGWFHATDCPTGHGEKIGTSSQAKELAKREHPARGTKRPFVGVLERSNVVAIPIPLSGLPDTDRCPAHPTEDRWTCEPCSAIGEGYQT